MSTTAARLIGAAEVVAGTATVVAAGRLARSPLTVLGHRAVVPRPVMVGVVRFLGVRQATQGLVTLARPAPGVLLAGAAVDVLHGLSLVPFVVADGPYRRPAAGSVALALAGGVAALAAALREHR